MTRASAHSRHGISLLEVLISIGILAVGLTSVISLVPAGKSEAGRAVMLDRAALLAANVLSDAVSFGYARPHSFVSSSATSSLVVFDPAVVAGPWPAAASLKNQGVFGASGSSATAAPQVSALVTQGRDDLIYELPTTADEPPVNKFSEGTRAFQGRTTSLIALARAGGGAPLAAGALAKLTVVVFHGRDLANPFVTGTYEGRGGVITFAVPTGRRINEIVRPGTVVYDQSAPPDSCFCQVAMASVNDSNPSTPVVYVTFSGAAPSESAVPIPIQILVDSVGMADRTVTLEGPGPYSR
ncbi:MAG: prepilin-type N-terminal cleavage/methylation domain-containing protein [Planctomycetia bacterium]|nr:prepilin-type N-terminal cleavage/methylation domain-containing protein [Planctomycetia bacterium]